MVSAKCSILVRPNILPVTLTFKSKGFIHIMYNIIGIDHDTLNILLYIMFVRAFPFLPVMTLTFDPEYR